MKHETEVTYVSADGKCRSADPKEVLFHELKSRFSCGFCDELAGVGELNRLVVLIRQFDEMIADAQATPVFDRNKIRNAISSQLPESWGNVKLSRTRTWDELDPGSRAIYADFVKDVIVRLAETGVIVGMKA